MAMTSATLPHDFIPSDDGRLRICRVCGYAVFWTDDVLTVLAEGEPEKHDDPFGSLPPEFVSWAERYFDGRE